MGGYNGTSFTRLQTWWKAMPEFTAWLARCEELLEAGHPSQDVLWYLGDAVDHKPDEEFAFPEGFRADYLNHDVLTNRLTVKDGLFTIPEGTKWRVVWVPDPFCMRPATRRALDHLSMAGGKVVYGDKAALSRTLSAFPKDVATEPSLGDGQSEDFMWIHRMLDGGDRYFVAAGTNGYSGRVTFRAVGNACVYDPVSEECREWTNGMLLEIPPSRSLFVEFGICSGGRWRKSEGVREFASRELKGWDLSFAKGWGTPEHVRLEVPMSWTDIPGFAREARAYSGTVTYETEFGLPPVEGQPLTLSLGRVESVAIVFVNGRRVRTLWCEPYVCDIGEFTKPGVNRLRIEVMNTWRNRVIYDLGLPESQRKTWILHRPGFNPDKADPFVPSGILGPVTLTGQGF